MGLSGNFNPRARVGHDISKCAVFRCGVFQSTCPRGARRRDAAEPRGAGISIHVPAWGTTGPRTRAGLVTHFNPRARVGHDGLLDLDLATVVISIHVPAWGTTLTTTPTRSAPNFNPRARVGHDRAVRVGKHPCGISIHVPAWGTTRRYKGGLPTYHISIHVPAWGTTRNYVNIYAG